MIFINIYVYVYLYLSIHLPIYLELWVFWHIQVEEVKINQKRHREGLDMKEEKMG